MTGALILSTIVGIGIFLWVLYLYRERRLKEDLALFWLLFSVAVIVLPMSTIGTAGGNVSGILDWSNASLAGISVLLIIAGVHQSVRISKLRDQSMRLAQEIALVKSALPASQTDPPPEDTS